MSPISKGFTCRVEHQKDDDQHGDSKIKVVEPSLPEGFVPTGFTLAVEMLKYVENGWCQNMTEEIKLENTQFVKRDEIGFSCMYNLRDCVVISRES